MKKTAAAPTDDDKLARQREANRARQEAFRIRQAQATAAEVRGLFAHVDDHQAIKAFAAELAARRTKGTP